MVTALPRAEAPWLMIRMMQNTIAAASLPVPSLISSRIGTLSCMLVGEAVLTALWTYPVGLAMMVGRSLMEKPRTRIQTTPTKNCEMMTIRRILGMTFLGFLTSSARCVGQSRPINVEKLLNNPSRIAKPVEE